LRPGGQPQFLELRELTKPEACGDVAPSVVTDRQVGDPVARSDAAV
jgi:hypothetical protein